MSSDYITIPLTKGYSAIIDAVDADLAELKWYADMRAGKFYAIRAFQSVPKQIKRLLGHVIMERQLERHLEYREQVHHINGDTLDCRRDNLFVSRIEKAKDNCDGTFCIALTKGQFSIVDQIDVDLADLRWSAWKAEKGNFYAIRGKTRLHTVILERKIGRCLDIYEVVDHVNMNTLDNRRCNLRIADFSQNQQNKWLQSNNTSGFKGVTYHKMTRKWEARIGVNGKRIYLGLFDTKQRAIDAYIDASKRYHKDFGRIDND